ncbi:hypothetical protein M493_03470 [Geobacillus genomosp. 3]|uniref:ABC-2 type transporter transmembrane domain-containing protein n=1 Tax=Geobacillus genomosp. 3 TaxID=1921421 RepID=S6A0A9_GEOG3|nr:YhgE/Pip domain-containing protein [Geobacillus genomosp. 3]AGT31001.1 hypothetical protein M493_03470 [Geobacillus genomosp. 3]
MLMKELQAILLRPKVLIPVLAVLFIPLLYSGSFLWAFWDPYGHLDRLPVAVVNEDEGALLDGKKIQLGNDVVKRLKENGTFDWQFVSRKQADDGLEDGTYYMAVMIPKDFSANATTVQSGKPKPLKLVYIPNEGANYLAGKIGDSAIEAIKEEMANNVTRTYVETMLAKMQEAADGLGEAGKGASQLHDGVQAARKGGRALVDGMTGAEQGSARLSAGAKQAKDGADELTRYLTELAEKSLTFENGLQAANSGAKQVQDGTASLADGLGQLAGGSRELADGATAAQHGAASLAGGLHDSLSALKELQTQLPVLTDGANRLQHDASQLSGEVEMWKRKANEAAAGGSEVQKGLEQYAAGLQVLAAKAQDPQEKETLQALYEQLQPLVEESGNVANGVGALADGMEPIQNGLSRLAGAASALASGQQAAQSGVGKLVNGQQQLVNGADRLLAAQQTLADGADKLAKQLQHAHDGAQTLAAGSRELAEGVNKLASGSAGFVSGTNQLAEGANQLSNGVSAVAEGASSLHEGLGRLARGGESLLGGLGRLEDGAEQLADRLQEGAEKADGIHADDQASQMIADPVQKDKQPLYHVPNYGTGFAPYFLSLGLFVGALLLTIVFPLREPAGRPSSGFAWFFGKWGVLAAAAAAQTLLADAWLLYGLGLHVQSVGRFVLLTWIISMTFMMIVQCLVTLFDNPGRFVAILLLIAQLIGSAGTYPLELVPGALQRIHQWLPMTHAIRGLRAVILSGDFTLMWKEASILAGVAAVFAAATLGYFLLLYRRRYRAWAETETAA